MEKSPTSRRSIPPSPIQGMRKLLLRLNRAEKLKLKVLECDIVKIVQKILFVACC